MPPEGRLAVEVAERYVAFQATEEELYQANEAVGDLCTEAPGSHDEDAGFQARSAARAAFHASYSVCELEEAEDCSRNAESAGFSGADQARLIRELFDPFEAS